MIALTPLATFHNLDCAMAICAALLTERMIEDALASILQMEFKIN